MLDEEEKSLKYELERIASHDSIVSAAQKFKDELNGERLEAAYGKEHIVAAQLFYT